MSKPIAIEKITTISEWIKALRNNSPGKSFLSTLSSVKKSVSYEVVYRFGDDGNELSF